MFHYVLSELYFVKQKHCADAASFFVIYNDNTNLHLCNEPLLTTRLF